MEKKNEWLIELSREDIWAKNLDSLPSMICHAYNQLKALTENGQVYGVMLQCKDLYESLLKVPLIMALIVIESTPANKDKDEYREIIKKTLKDPLSIGGWYKLSTAMTDEDADVGIPDTLCEILVQTEKLYEKRVSPVYQNIAHWRNNAIGHGALKFEDDEYYRIEIRNLLTNVKEYFENDSERTIPQLYESAYFFCGETKLTGKQHYPSEPKESIKLSLNDQVYDVEHYITDNELKIYLFDSFYSSRKQIKYSSYIDGHEEMGKDPFFIDLYDRFVVKGIKDFDFTNSTITREQAEILELLHEPIKYYKPAGLLDELKQRMKASGRGTISIFMERGTGKSAFANQMSGLFNHEPLIKNSFSRCYHIRNATLRGINDFFHAVNFSFRHEYDSHQDLYSTTDEFPALSSGDADPARALAAFLNFYHKLYDRTYTILLIDGIDEITDNIKAVLDYLPPAEALEKGVFIILLSRFKDEESIQGSSRQYIAIAEKASDDIIRIRRHDDANISTLKKCIDDWKSKQEGRAAVDTEELLERADYRFLYLKAYLEVSSDILLDKRDEKQFIQSYLNHIMSFYGQKQKNKALEIVVTIALFPSITLKKYQEYLNCPGLTYEFIGIMNDLLPLMTVNHIDGEDAYELADSAFAEYVLDNYEEEIKTVLRFYRVSFDDHLHLYYDPDYYESEKKKKDPDYAKSLRRSLVFFAESYINIMHLANRHKAVENWFFTDYSFWLLAAKLVLDPEARLGYLYYLLDEMYNGIFSILYTSIQSKKTTLQTEWTDKLNSIMINQGSKNKKFNSVHIICDCLQTTDELEQLAEYFISSHKMIIHPELWLWVLECKQTPETARFILENGYLEAFTNYLQRHIIHSDETIWWFDQFLSCKLSYQAEEKLLNQKLNILLRAFFTGYPHWPGSRTTDCLVCMKEKGYSIIPDIAFNAIDEKKDLEPDIDLLIQHICKGTLGLSELSARINASVKVLLDFNPDEESGSIISSMRYIQLANYQIFPEYKNYQNIPAASEAFQRYFDAYYQRICYEYQQNTLLSFVEDDTDYLCKFIVHIITVNTGSAQEKIQRTEEWITRFENLASGKSKPIIQILSRLYVSLVKLYEPINKEKAIKVMEKYIYEWDTYAFFAERDLKYTTNSQQHPLVYCCRNALYLLYQYYQENNTACFNSLMRTIESSIPLIDHSIIQDMKSEAICSIEKYRFMKLRAEMNYTSPFDQYISYQTEEIWKLINSEFQCLSQSTDFHSLLFKIELLLEHPWQTQKWQDGLELCKKILHLIDSSDYRRDETVTLSINRIIEVVDLCIHLFEFTIVHDQGMTAGPPGPNNHANPLSYADHNYLEVNLAAKELEYYRQKNPDYDPGPYRYCGVFPFDCY